MLEWTLGGLAAAGAAASARWAWWRKSVKGLSVLMYHKVGQPPEGTQLQELWVSTEAFDRQMKFLKDEGFNVVRFTDVDRSIRTGEPLPEKAVLVTFDDGYRNNYLEAYPVLKKYGIPAGIFLVYETIGKHNQWHDPKTEAWLSMLRWEDIREMSDSKLVEYGSHTMRHRNLGKAPIEEARWELQESKKRFEDALGREFPAFAYPYGGGADDPKVRDEVLGAGYRFDFSIVQEKAALPLSSKAAIPRLFISWGDTKADFALKMRTGKSRIFGDQL